MISIATDKNEIRRKIRNRRRVLEKKFQVLAAQQLCDRLFKVFAIRRAKRIAVYLAQFGEIDLTQFTLRAWRRHKEVYLPVLPKPALNRMRFAHYHPKSRLLPNLYNINEPVVSNSRLLTGAQLDVVLVPLVAFDKGGNRLGMGGGFYDRTFQFRLTRSSWKKPLLIGVAYDFQEMLDLDPEPWDVPLDAVFTETRSIWFNHEASYAGT